VIEIILAILYLITSALGLLLFKMGNNQIKTIIYFQNGAVQFLISYMAILGMLCYIASFITFMILVTRHNLTYILPVLTGCVYILVFLGAVFILKEKVSLLTVAGSIITIIGVLMIISTK
jgi:drug/metabolite transporter (DMT)-like permease